MHVSALEVASAIVIGGLASAVGGYFGGIALAGKDIGKDLAGFLGMLYGPAAGATGVIVGVAIVLVLAARTSS